MIILLKSLVNFIGGVILAIFSLCVTGLFTGTSIVCFTLYKIYGFDTFLGVLVSGMGIVLGVIFALMALTVGIFCLVPSSKEDKK